MKHYKFQHHKEYRFNRIIVCLKTVLNNKLMEQIKQNGIFYRLASEERTNFIKSELYYSVLPDDYIKYTRLPSGDIYIDEIVKRNKITTIGILDTCQKKLRLPLISKQFCITIKYSPILSYEYIFCYVSTINNEITITTEIGSVENRTYDFKICSNLYHSVIGNTEMSIPLEKELHHFYSIDDIRDQTELFTFNIDPKESLDFDDAISVNIEKGIIYIHIVDIHTHLNSLKMLEKDAIELGQTLYLAEGNINLFPNKYSDNKFSLIKDKERPVITLEYDIKKDSYEIYRSKIIIKKRYDYESAQEALEKGEEQLVFLDKVIQPPKWIYSSFQLPQRKLIMKGDQIDHIEFRIANRINKIIEALMILTNRKVTEHLDGLIPERYHEKSNEEVIITNTDLIDPILIIEKLKKYKLAKYSDIEGGHYALKIPLYTHFTSPIRRSFDILIHHILAGSKYTNRYLSERIEHINKREIENTKLVEFYERCKLLSYFEKNKIKKHLAKISSITKHGINIYLLESGYYDFIHISKIIKEIRWKYIECDSAPKLIGTNGIILEKEKECFIEICSINWFELAVDRYRICEFI